MEAQKPSQEIYFPKSKFDPKSPITHLPMTNKDDGLDIPKKERKTKDSFLKIMGKISKKILKGGLLNLTELTLPAVMLHEITNVEATILGFNYMMAYTTQAVEENLNPLERLKMVLTGAIANAHNPSRVLQSNAPIPAQIGETIQV